MTLKQLATAGRELGLKFHKGVKKAERAKRIIAAQAIQAAESHDAPADVPSSDETPTPRPPGIPSFDALLEGDESIPAESGGDGRGGKREGAGRPEGSTDEVCRMKRLSQQPHPVVTSSLEFLFARWAASVGCDQIKLDKDEAFALALAWTQIGDYLGVTERIPVWLQLAVTATWTTANIVANKRQIAVAFRDARLAEQEQQQAAAGEVTS